MASRFKTPRTPSDRQPRLDLRAPSKATIVWGPEIESENWLKVPKVLLRLGQYHPIMGKELQPRHVLLVLALAARKFQDRPIICSWNELAKDLGVKRDTVRHWAYELREHGLLRIRYPKTRATSSGAYLRQANTFEIDGFTNLVSDAFRSWKIHGREAIR